MAAFPKASGPYEVSSCGGTARRSAAISRKSTGEAAPRHERHPRLLLDREPHATASSGLWALIEERKASGFVAAYSPTTIHDLVRKDRDARVARRVIGTSLKAFRVARVDEAVLSREPAPSKRTDRLGRMRTLTWTRECADNAPPRHMYTPGSNADRLRRRSRKCHLPRSKCTSDRRVRSQPARPAAPCWPTPAA
jgi:hypothetical protein